MTSRRGRVALACALAGLVLAAQAAAAPPWLERYRRGLGLEAHGAWGKALAEFQAAAQVMPHPATHVPLAGREVILDYDPHYHMAVCLLELGRPRQAAGQLKVAADAQVTPPEKLKALWQRIQTATAEKFPPTAPPAPPPAAGQLLVRTEPAGAGVTVDGARMGVTPLGPLALPAGEHVVRVEASGFRRVEERVTIAPGQAETLLIPLAAKPMPTRHAVAATAPEAPGAAGVTPPQSAAPQPPVSSAPKRARSARPRTRPASATLAVLAAAALAVAAALWLRARRRRTDAKPKMPTAPTVAIPQATTFVETGARVGPYELLAVLGRGGMATTYRARRLTDGQTVALKVPHEGYQSDATFITRFLREGRLGEQLHHPRIVRIHDTGEEKGRPFLAMELVSGRTLKKEMQDRAPLPLRRALEIARDIAEALDYAHAKGVVHRDLKPENVMILPDGTVKVMDFGIARLSDQPGLTTSNIFLGTPLYAAPEMVDPKTIDRRVDLYSLGVILYEMLEGAVPFTADSPYRVLEMHMRQPLPPREALAHPVPERVWAVVQKLCEKDPANRYAGAEALLVELNRLLQSFHELEGGDVF
jgi:hypothetical protein